MKVHKTTFGEVNQLGSIWCAVDMAKREHRLMMGYKRGREWSLQSYCRTNRDTMMRIIRVIARGLLATVARTNRKLNREGGAE